MIQKCFYMKRMCL